MRKHPLRSKHNGSAWLRQKFEQFRADDYQCRQFALEQVGGSTPNQASATSGVASAAVRTGLGAAAGAAIGGGAGAAIGAGGGLLGGSLVGAGTGRSSAYIAQQRSTWAIYNACTQMVTVFPYQVE